MKTFLIILISLISFCNEKPLHIKEYSGKMLGFFDQTDSVYFQDVDFTITEYNNAKTVKVLEFSFDIEEDEIMYMSGDSVFISKLINKNPNSGYAMLEGKLKK